MTLVHHDPVWEPAMLPVNAQGDLKPGFVCVHQLENGSGPCSGNVFRVEDAIGQHSCDVPSAAVMTYAHDAHCNTAHTAGPQECPPAREPAAMVTILIDHSSEGASFERNFLPGTAGDLAELRKLLDKTYQDARAYLDRCIGSSAPLPTDTDSGR